MAPVAENEYLTIGAIAARSGVAPSALRYYEAEGLLSSIRGPGGQRRYERSVLRRVAVLRAAQSLGLTLDEIRLAFESLPAGRTPIASDWTRLSRSWKKRLTQRIGELERLRDKLTGCIGCGCLTLGRCALFNPSDRVAEQGPGARLLNVPARDGR
jgi:MerR family transcriptional regulator, redox-sensitive transcriptional activator SoxR